MQLFGVISNEALDNYIDYTNSMIKQYSQPAHSQNIQWLTYEDSVRVANIVARSARDIITDTKDKLKSANTNNINDKALRAAVAFKILLALAPYNPDSMVNILRLAEVCKSKILKSKFNISIDIDSDETGAYILIFNNKTKETDRVYIQNPITGANKASLENRISTSIYTLALTDKAKTSKSTMETRLTQAAMVISEAPKHFTNILTDSGRGELRPKLPTLQMGEQQYYAMMANTYHLI